MTTERVGTWTKPSRAAVASLAAACLLLAPPGAARAAGAAYVADEAASFGSPFVVAQFAIGAGGLLAPLSPPAVPTDGNGSPQAVAVTPDGGNVYVVSVGPIPPPQPGLGGTVAEYRADPSTGALTPTGSVPAGGFAQAIAVAPDGRHAYVANADATVSQYAIATTGALAPLSPATVPSAGFGGGVAITPDGRSAYVTALGGGASQYDVDPVTGALAPKPAGPVSTPAGLRGVAVSRDGRSAYVAAENAGEVLQYDIDPATGALSPKGRPAVPTPEPFEIAVSPDGRSAYVTNFATGQPTDTVSQFDVDPVTGELTPKTPASVAAGSRPSGIAVTADGTSAYVVDVSAPASGVSQYTIDPATGRLSPKSPSIVAAGAEPVDVAVTPAPAAPSAPTSKEQCKHGGWQRFPQFNNQGACVSSVARRR
jgi:DNA-binding beta-propeller fold protein YncE